jgi:hypothetical protein
MGEDWLNREGSTMRANNMGAALGMLAAAALLGACAVADFGTVRPSADITRQFQDLEINPNYRYWYLNQENNPFGVLGLDREYHFEGGPMWGALDPDTATFKKVVGLVKSFPAKGSSTSGFEIMDPQGRPIGVWFSSLTAGINVDFAKKTVSVSTPTPWLRPYSMLSPEHNRQLASGRHSVRNPG